MVITIEDLSRYDYVSELTDAEVNEIYGGFWPAFWAGYTVGSVLARAYLKYA